MVDRRRPNPAAQDYLTAIHGLQREHGRAVTTTDLADALGVTSASASTMVKRLAARGLALRAPYRGARLTHSGEQIAERTSARRRLLATFLADELGMARDRVDEHAALLEHGVSAEVEALIAARVATARPEEVADAAAA